MRRMIAPALLAVSFVVAGSADANAFGLFDRVFRGHGSGCCDVEPACGCEPVCGAEVAAPVCEPVCCDATPHCRGGLLHRLFHRGECCDAAPVCEPVCGCEVVEPVCGCEPVCDGHHHKRGGLLGRLFGGHRHHDCCEPACGIEPTCGLDVAPSCGCAL